MLTLHLPVQAVMTSSVFVHDIQAPAPLEEFFVPLRDEVRGPAEHAARNPSKSGLGSVSELDCWYTIRSETLA